MSNSVTMQPTVNFYAVLAQLKSKGAPVSCRGTSEGRALGVEPGYELVCSSHPKDNLVTWSWRKTPVNDSWG